MGCQRPEININLVIATDPLHLPVFKNTQQLGLKRKRHITDFVKKQSAALGQFNPSFARLVRAGKGAFLVAEDLGLKKLGRDRGAIHRNKAPCAAGCGMHRARNQLLAGACLSKHKHAGW